MKIDKFEDFFQKAQQLFLEDPDNTRYSISYTPGDQRMRIKVTDDKTTLNFETEDLPTVKRIDALTSIMLKLMSCPTIEFDAIKDIIKKSETS